MIAFLGFFRLIPTWAYAAAFAVLLAGLGGYHERVVGEAKGRADVTADWNADTESRHKAEVKAVDTRLAENEAMRAQFADNLTKETANHEKELADDRATQQRNATRRVQVGADFCHQGTPAPAQANSTGGTQQTAAPGWFLPDAFTANLRDLTAQADAIVADARTVQTSVIEAKCF